MSTTRLCKECRTAVEGPVRICAECQNERSIEKGEAARRTERRKFAAMQMQGLLSTVTIGRSEFLEVITDTAIKAADMLIAELDRTEKKS